jgi:predicted RND superfamily exporter protein
MAHGIFLTDILNFEAPEFSLIFCSIQTVITTPLDYSNNETQARVFEVLNQLTSSSGHMTPEYQENWLSSFLSFVERYSELYDYNITTEQTFIDTLRTEFLPNSIYAEDVKFNENNTKILATRYILQSVNVYTIPDQREMAEGLREVAASQTDFKVTVFHFWFSFVDQSLIIRELTVKLVAFAAGTVMIVAVIFIPNILCSLCVFFTIASIELGVLGFMSLWNVNLDMISILTLVMCVGFSVDFTAHVSYSYISAEGNSEERIRKTMYSLGLPILQGAVSTMIGVVLLIFVPSYIFQTFFKVIMLVMTISMGHGLFLLPVILLILKPETLSCCCSSKKSINVKQGDEAL